jgi:hypothetical protein
VKPNARHRQQRRRAIEQTPKQTRGQQHDDEFSQRNMRGERGIARDAFWEIVHELPQQPADRHAYHREPVQRLRERSIARFCIGQLHRQISYLGKILTLPRPVKV